MAGFELSRIGSVTGIARETQLWRHAPLYIAGVAIGIAMGLGIGFYQQSRVSLEPYSSPPAISDVPLTVPEIPEVLPAAPLMPVVNAVPILTAPPLPAQLAPVFTPPAPETEPAAAPEPPAPPAPLAAAPQAAAPAQPAAAPPPPAAPAQPAAEAPAAPASTAKPNFYVPAVAGGGATELETRLLNGINAERAKAGLAPYVYDSGLTKIARTRSQQMVDQGYFGHKDPYGYTMYVELLAYFGYDSYAWAGENLAMNNYAVGESPERAVVSLMNSPTHRANLLASDFSRIGIGEVTTADGRHFYSMIFLG